MFIKFNFTNFSLLPEGLNNSYFPDVLTFKCQEMFGCGRQHDNQTVLFFCQAILQSQFNDDIMCLMLLPHDAQLIISMFESGLFKNVEYSHNPGILQRAIDSLESASM